MTPEQIKDFSLRISQCNRTELIVIMDEIIIAYIKGAQDGLMQGEKETFRFQLEKARQFLDELSSSLDMRFEISHELSSLYSYVRKSLILASAKENGENLAQCISIMERLREAFEQVTKNDQSGKMIQGSQKVYAGLTYGPGSNLNEIVF